MVARRIASILSNIPPHVRVADVGSDHAYVPIKLALRGNPTPVVAIEVKTGPYSQSKVRISRANVDVDLRLGDGLEPLAPGEADWIILAGLGGITIKDILTRSWDKLNTFSVLLLQPIQGADYLREFLYRRKLGIIDEWVVKEKNKFYQFIKVVPREIGVSPKLRATYSNIDKEFLIRTGPRLLLNRSQETSAYLTWRLSLLKELAPKVTASKQQVLEHEISMWNKVIECHCKYKTVSR